MSGPLLFESGTSICTSFHYSAKKTRPLYRQLPLVSRRIYSGYRHHWPYRVGRTGFTREGGFVRCIGPNFIDQGKGAFVDFQGARLLTSFPVAQHSVVDFLTMPACKLSY